jgi:hypothetical protein
MSIGLGIFLGCVFLGSVFLYLKTANTLNWKKFGKRTLLIGAAFFLLAATAGVGGYAYTEWQGRPQFIKTLGRISVGEKLSEVVFKNGIYEQHSPPPNAAQKHVDQQEYSQKDSRVEFGVRNGIVNTVTYGCKQESDYVAINKIYCNDSGDKIKELFGSKVRILCRKLQHEKAELERVYDVSEYGTRYYVVQNKVVAFLIADRNELESLVGINWDTCK